jgi:hypothetical protein
MKVKPRNRNKEKSKLDKMKLKKIVKAKPRKKPKKTA